MKKITNSESYDIVFCKLCNRDAKLPEDPDNFNALHKVWRVWVYHERETSPLRKSGSIHGKGKTTLYDIRIKKVAYGG